MDETRTDETEAADEDEAQASGGNAVCICLRASLPKNKCELARARSQSSFRLRAQYAETALCYKRAGEKPMPSTPFYASEQFLVS